MFTHDGGVALVKKLSLSPQSQENPWKGFSHLSAHAPLAAKTLQWRESWTPFMDEITAG